MILENLKLSEVIKLIEDKPDQISGIYNNVYVMNNIHSFTVNAYWWTSGEFLWTVELQPIKKELTRNEIGRAWDIESVTVKNAKISSESKFFKSICERLGL